MTAAGPYRIDRTSNWRRKMVEEWLFGLDLLSPRVREDVVTAWVSAWASSTHERLEDMPFSPSAAGFYPLMEHVNEVTRAGVWSVLGTAPPQAGARRASCCAPPRRYGRSRR